jgi:hypothetical protein
MAAPAAAETPEYRFSVAGVGSPVACAALEKL